MQQSKFLKALAKIADDLQKENTVLVPDETKGKSIPMRADKVRAFLGAHASSTKDDSALTLEFAEAYYKLPLMGRTVLSLRYGLFSGVTFNKRGVQHLTGIDSAEVGFIEERGRQRIYAELGINDYQEPSRPFYTGITVKKKIRRSAYLEGMKLNANQLGESLVPKPKAP